MTSIDLSLNHQDSKLLQDLLNVWNQKRGRNAVRTVYFEGKQPFKDFGIAIPPKFLASATSLGWTHKGVTALTNRSDFQGFVTPDGEDDPYDIAELLVANNFALEFDQAKVSSAVHGCSFISVSHGDVQSGEPDVLMMMHAANSGGGLWSRRRRAIRGFLSIVDVDDSGTPTVMTMYQPEKAMTFTKTSRGWDVVSQVNPLGETSVALLPFQPELNKPFGHSRITQTSMDIVDSAARSILRSEVQAELYSAPQYWLLNADMEAFGSDKWKAVIGRIMALGQDPDADGEASIQRFEGASPGPHTEHMRMWATMFAADQDLALSSMGIVQDNPSSAEAIYAAKEELIVETGNANKWWGAGASKAASMAVRLRDGLGVQVRLGAEWIDPALTNPAAKADAFAKRAAAITGYADTDVGLADAGLTRAEIARFKAERDRARVRETTSALVARFESGQPATVPVVADA